MNSKIKWNNEVKLIISDVDGIIADFCLNASNEITRELEKLLIEDKVLFLISGQSVQNIYKRVVSQIKKELRYKILIGHCSGIEIFEFVKEGNLNQRPIFNLYKEPVSESQKKQWRKIIKQLKLEFKIKIYPPMPIDKFKEITNDHQLCIMYEDRRPQIIFEVANAYDLTLKKIKQLKSNRINYQGLTDLGIPIINRATELFLKVKIPIQGRLAGVFAIDFVINGISKTTAVRKVINDEEIHARFLLNKNILDNPKLIEVWGDKFSTVNGETDIYKYSFTKKSSFNNISSRKP